MSKRFGIDIDGTVTSPETFVSHLNKAFNANLTYEDITEYDFLPFVNATREELAQWFTDNEAAIYKTSPLAPHAKEILQQWHKQHELFFISARSDKLLDVTENWFNEHDVSFHHIELIGTHFKVEAAKKHKVDIFFEDKHDNACDISEECDIPVILFDTPYNRLPVPSKVVRVHNWIEANEWVNNWLKIQS
ncbi:hypothetical protein A2U94_02125 [Bacillus sp. VT 712]|uniref:5' nucleotidase, NT5C type n=1 Tax=Bacillaceae TaxID=186817 RepID=UPI00047424CF|nr:MULTISPECIES: nucleotidase [Bacillaceae]KZB93089.1 hypothetical protein A2U94_02125 [Bacillus sp. VT 712]